MFSGISSVTNCFDCSRDQLISVLQQLKQFKQRLIVTNSLLYTCTVDTT